jgi:hypothetical protein
MKPTRKITTNVQIRAGFEEMVITENFLSQLRQAQPEGNPGRIFRRLNHHQFDCPFPATTFRMGKRIHLLRLAH